MREANVFHQIFAMKKKYLATIMNHKEYKQLIIGQPLVHIIDNVAMNRRLTPQIKLHIKDVIRTIIQKEL